MNDQEARAFVESELRRVRTLRQERRRFVAEVLVQAILAAQAALERRLLAEEVAQTPAG